jgi:hypothetical protein
VLPSGVVGPDIHLTDMYFKPAESAHAANLVQRAHRIAGLYNNTPRLKFWCTDAVWKQTMGAVDALQVITTRLEVAQGDPERAMSGWQAPFVLHSNLCAPNVQVSNADCCATADSSADVSCTGYVWASILCTALSFVNPNAVR